MNDGGDIHVANCYGCGVDNPVGLHARFETTDGRVVGEFTSNEHHVGPPGLLHGGIIFAIVDEALSYLCRSKMLDYEVRTIRQEIMFRNPSPIRETIRVEAWIEKEKSRTVVASARVYSETNTIAEARGTLFKIRCTDE